jgi:hypothetical protein
MSESSIMVVANALRLKSAGRIAQCAAADQEFPAASVLGPPNDRLFLPDTDRAWVLK